MIALAKVNLRPTCASSELSSRAFLVSSLGRSITVHPVPSSLPAIVLPQFKSLIQITRAFTGSERSRMVVAEEVRHGRRSACAHAYFTGNANTSGPTRAGSGR